MRLLGLDVGQKTIGVAVCDEEGRVATPLRTLGRRGGRADIEAVASVMTEMEATGLVLGLPRDLQGAEGPAALRARALGDALRTRLGCEVSYWDERFSTSEAERVLLMADVSRRRRKEVINHLAACIILQGFLDSRGGCS